MQQVISGDRRYLLHFTSAALIARVCLSSWLCICLIQSDAAADAAFGAIQAAARNEINAIKDEQKWRPNTQTCCWGYKSHSLQLQLQVVGNKSPPTKWDRHLKSLICNLRLSEILSGGQLESQSGRYGILVEGGARRVTTGSNNKLCVCLMVQLSSWAEMMSVWSVFSW